MENSASRLKRAGIHFAIAIVFASVLTIIDWSSVTGREFADRANYTENLVYQPNRNSYVSFDEWYRYVTEEFLWHEWMNWIIKEGGVPIDVIFNTIGWYLFFVFALFVLKSASPLYLPLLVNPLLINLAYSQSRLALAISILTTAVLLRKRMFSVASLVIAPLIHTGALLFELMYMFSLYIADIRMRLSLSKGYVAGLLILAGIVIAVVTGPLRADILRLLADRRVELQGMSSGYLYVSFWIGLLAVCLFQGESFLLDRHARFSFLVLSMVAVGSFMGVYVSRFLAASFPALIVGISMVHPPSIRRLVILLLLVYQLFQWIYWI